MILNDNDTTIYYEDEIVIYGGMLTNSKERYTDKIALTLKTDGRRESTTATNDTAAIKQTIDTKKRY